MKKALLGIFYALLGLFLIFVGGSYVLPGTAHVERQTVVAVTPDKVFAIVSDLQRAKEWQTWFSLDPAMQVTITGNGPGVGQKLAWSSNNPQVGTGTQETTEFVQDQKVVAALDFGPMGKAKATVLLAPEGSGTKVTWAFDTDLKSAVERWFGLMFDRMIGPDFEKGLASLKATAEKQG
jgi:carbon monoxide dehydrogenase subunit G